MQILLSCKKVHQNKNRNNIWKSATNRNIQCSCLSHPSINCLRKDLCVQACQSCLSVRPLLERRGSVCVLSVHLCGCENVGVWLLLCRMCQDALIRLCMHAGCPSTAACVCQYVLGTWARRVGACVQVHPLGVRVWLGRSVWGLTLSRHDRSK